MNLRVRLDCAGWLLFSHSMEVYEGSGEQIECSLACGYCKGFGLAAVKKSLCANGCLNAYLDPDQTVQM